MKGQFKTLDRIEKNANSSKEQWKVLKNEISMLKQSKIALEKDGTIQFQLASKKKMRILLKTLIQQETQ